jgi:hypothetical protein
MFYVFSLYMSALHALNMPVARLYAQDMWCLVGGVGGGVYAYRYVWVIASVFTCG